MSKTNEVKISGDIGDDLMRACNDAQQINLNGHAYIITFVDKTDDPALIKLKRIPSGDHALNNDEATYRYKKEFKNPYLVMDQGKDDKLIDLVKEIRDSIGEGKITLFKRMEYIQAVINLAEGFPASMVAEALDKSAEYVRNQKVQAYWEEK
ncbi:hypothetical protein IWT25_00748 [Secundilactobacillus pentosiphilus]|uniref:Uncharacterized protein n=1 Tax=Secundilactobacillus pentosiphilus TaxID=1714682 RepID=A0A1Z5IV22_9LACO|nr:hypothetical protein [Secundilactobacillus pentosiphilus]GAX05442.1 hypothetical protein IWT25_00748 [Secundilactobacillus pentosiphilus]